MSILFLSYCCCCSLISLTFCSSFLSSLSSFSFWVYLSSWTLSSRAALLWPGPPPQKGCLSFTPFINTIRDAHHQGGCLSKNDAQLCLLRIGPSTIVSGRDDETPAYPLCIREKHDNLLFKGPPLSKSREVPQVVMVADRDRIIQSGDKFAKDPIHVTLLLQSHSPIYMIFPFTQRRFFVNVVSGAIKTVAFTQTFIYVPFYVHCH